MSKQIRVAVVSFVVDHYEIVRRGTWDGTIQEGFWAKVDGESININDLVPEEDADNYRVTMDALHAAVKAAESAKLSFQITYRNTLSRHGVL